MPPNRQQSHIVHLLEKVHSGKELQVTIIGRSTVKFESVHNFLNDIETESKAAALLISESFKRNKFDWCSNIFGRCVGSSYRDNTDLIAIIMLT
jgi:hypothetical protein